MGKQEGNLILFLGFWRLRPKSKGLGSALCPAFMGSVEQLHLHPADHLVLAVPSVHAGQRGHEHPSHSHSVLGLVMPLEPSPPPRRPEEWPSPGMGTPCDKTDGLQGWHMG